MERIIRISGCHDCPCTDYVDNTGIVCKITRSGIAHYVNIRSLPDNCPLDVAPASGGEEVIATDEEISIISCF